VRSGQPGESFQRLVPLSFAPGWVWQSMASASIHIGTAGWNIPAAARDRFGCEGTALERYGRVLHCVEINSTFYRSHQRKTYERWAASVPDDFAFSVKMPKQITHVRKLIDCAPELQAFVEETAALGGKREVLLVQLPPKLGYDPNTARLFFSSLLRMYGGKVALEPRHPSWFARDVDAWLASIGVARVAADPAPVPEGAMPGGNRDFCYYRLHGSPRMYYSNYEPATIARIAGTIAGKRDVWCIFDNTASGYALGNALELSETLRTSSAQSALLTDIAATAPLAAAVTT
jgi:uncharacterized protein YecE (DUF72 family)